MCVIVFINGTECDTAGEVAQSLGIAVDTIPTVSGDPLRSDLCLCDADLDALAARHNMAIKRGTFGWMVDDIAQQGGEG